MQYQTVYRRIRLIIEPMGFQGPSSERAYARRRQRRNEKEQRGTTERRNEYIARACPSTCEVNIVTIIIDTALDVGFSLSLSPCYSYARVFEWSRCSLRRRCFRGLLREREREREEKVKKGRGRRNRGGWKETESNKFPSFLERSLHFLYPSQNRHTHQANGAAASCNDTWKKRGMIYPRWPCN